MSFLIKYRPEAWSDMVGQEKTVRSLAKAIATKKGNAFLFTGPSGVGKTTAARIAAAELGAVDPLEIDAATFTGIDDMRAITETLPYSMGDAARVVIVDECHALSKPAWQSLLKSLEEPPAFVFWFLCTTEVTKVPATVKTRCLHYSFKPVGLGDLMVFGESIAEKEDLPDDIIEVCAKEANGSPRQLLSNLAVCATAKNRAEAADLLRSAEESEEAVALARVLLNGHGWPETQGVLAKLRDKDAESIRRVVCAYMTSVALKVPKEALVGRATEVLDAFSEPFYNSVGISMVVKACAVLQLSRR